MSLAAGTRLGPYDVLGLIGAGGMGEVYKARDTRLDRTVAIKILPTELSSDPVRRARFEREAKTIAGLTHPHICTLYDIGRHIPSGPLPLAPRPLALSPVHYLVMEHLQGETLADRLLRGRLPLDQALGVATEIADALAVAHKQGIIHRDLKPGNVMLTKAGAKLLDFGLAKLKSHGAEPAAGHLASMPTQSAPLTVEGTIVGTLQPLTPATLDRLVRQYLAKSSDDRPDTAHDVASRRTRRMAHAIAGSRNGDGTTRLGSGTAPDRMRRSAGDVAHSRPQDLPPGAGYGVPDHSLSMGRAPVPGRPAVRKGHMRGHVVRMALVMSCLCSGVTEAAAETASKVTAGSSQTCAVTTAGGVVCWGGQHSTPVALAGLSSGVAAIAAGSRHTCALAAGGGVLCWGENSEGQLGDGTTTARPDPTPVSGLSSGVAAIAAGMYHTCALTTGGGALCWGRNGFGQLGDGTTTQRSAPTEVLGLWTGVTGIAAGGGHTCAVMADGSAKCWGDNKSGQLGDATTTRRSAPTKVLGLSTGVTGIATGGAHTCAVMADGSAKCWGDNNSGQIGDGTTQKRLVTTDVRGMPDAAAGIAAGGNHTCAWTTGGAALCWGDNGLGQVGDGTTTKRYLPTPVSGMAGGVAAVAAGFVHTCALTAAGGVACWGDNSVGQLGDGITTRRLTPTTVPGVLAGTAAVAAGGMHTCVLTAGGGVACWGYGTGAVPTPVSGLASGVAAIETGSFHTCAITTGGGLACWGENPFGQLGDGTTTSRLVPAAVSGLSSGVVAIAAGGGHTCALTAAGSVLCWGDNSVGQLGDGTTTSRLVPAAVSGLAGGVVAIDAGSYHTCAVKEGGGLVCWGRNDAGQLGDGTTTSRLVPAAVSGLSSGVVAIAAGGVHTCALTTAGSVLCWGSNSYGRLGDGTETNRWTPTAVLGLASSGVAAVSAGGSHTCALTATGGILCWGMNAFGQLGDGTSTHRLEPTQVSGLTAGVAAVSAGGGHTCARLTSGAVACWGADTDSQLGLGTQPRALLPVSTYGLGGAIAASIVAPRYGPVGGGTAVTISGAYFLQGATVTIGGVAAASVTVANPGTVTATTGAHAAGPADVVVRNPDGTESMLTGGFRYGAPIGGDFTGDVKSDVLWRHATRGEVWLWPMNGAVRTTETRVGTVADTNWEIRGVGDQNGDGKADILWRNKTTGMIYYWPMNGSTPLAETYVATVDPAYDIVGTGDYNGDGKSDILWRHLTNGEVWIWLMNGATPLNMVHVDTVAPIYVIKGSGDLDGDGKADLVWHHATTGAVWVWLMNGTTRRSETRVATVPDVGYQIVGVADHTGDGKADILWHHATRGEVWVWPMDGTTLVSQTYVDTVPDTGYQIVSNGDYNGDGKADILWHHATRGEVWVWLMDGTTKVSQSWVATVPDSAYQVVK